MRKTAVLSSLVLFSLTSFTQEDDSSAFRPRHDPKHISAREAQMGKFSWRPYDSTFSNTHHYYKPFGGDYLPFQDLGVMGSASASLWFRPVADPGFRSGWNMYDPYVKKAADAQIYRALQPFTQFNYWQGGSRFTVLEALHTQNIKPNWNISVDYRNLAYSGIYTQSRSSRGIYTGDKRPNNHQRANRINSYYRSKSERFSLLNTFTWNRMYRAETGNATEPLDSLAPPPLPDFRLTAGRSMYGRTEHLVRASWGLWNSDRDSQHRWPLQVFGSAAYQRERFQFVDDNADASYYFNNTFYNSTSTFDSTGIRQWKGEAGLVLTENEILPVYGCFSFAGNSMAAGNLYTGRWTGSNTSVHGQLGSSRGLPGPLRFHVRSDYYLSGYNAGDRFLTAVVKYSGKNLLLKYEWISQAATLSYVDQSFRSNHFIWDLGTGVQRISGVQAAELGFRMKAHSLTAHAESGTVRNWVWYDSTACPNVHSDKIRYSNLLVRYGFHTVHTHIRAETGWQHADADVIRIPAQWMRFQAYWQGYVFKKAMLLQAGADVFWYSRFRANNYMPASGQFFLQNSMSSGNYPLTDVFVNAEVKTVRIYIKLEHANQGISSTMWNSEYYSSYLYPFEPRRLRIGIQWKFYY